MQRNVSFRAVLAIILTVIGVAIAVSLYLTLENLGSGGALFTGSLPRIPGDFLWASFSYAAFLIPLYFLYSTVVLFLDTSGRFVAYDLNASLLPFFTLALILRLAFSPDGSTFIETIRDSFGTAGGVIVLLLFLFLEILMFINFRIKLKSVPRGIDAGTRGNGIPRSTADRRNQDPKRTPLSLPLYGASHKSAAGKTGGTSAVTGKEPVQAGAARYSVKNPGLDMPTVMRNEGEQYAFRVPVIPELPKLKLHKIKDIPEETVVSGTHDPNPAPEAEPPCVPVSILNEKPLETEDDLYEEISDEPDIGEFSEDPASGVYENLENDEYLRDDEEEFAEDFDKVSELEEDEEPEDSQAVGDEIEPDEPFEPVSEPAPTPLSARASASEPAPHAAAGKTSGEKPVPVRSAGKRRGAYSVPIKGVLKEYEDGTYHTIDEATQISSQVLKKTLEEFNIKADVTGIRKGPVITMFEILPAPGVKLSKIVNLADNIALRLAAQSVRIVAPIPGKHAVGIEVPNRNRAIVSFSEMLTDEAFTSVRNEIPVALGKDIMGSVQIMDLVQTPHLLIAGATGSGKSVCVNSLICSILYRRAPEEVRLMLIDPKIVELKFYNDIPHLLTPVITEPKKAFQALQWCIYEMERRYTLLDALGVRDIRSYNRRIKDRNLATQKLPYIVVVVDEFADLMATTGKELESTLARLAAMSRAVGIHLVLATQRPSIDVITGLIKANIPSRIAFMVASKFDSRIIIDSVGAEKLLGRGDMLFASAWDPFPVRLQGAYLTEEEVERIVEHVKTFGEPDYIDDEIFFDDDEDEDMYEEGEEDPLLDKAINIIVSAGKASASYLQRRLKIGYNRAARLVEHLEHIGIVGPQNGSKPREILHVPEGLQRDQ